MQNLKNLIKNHLDTSNILILFGYMQTSAIGHIEHFGDLAVQTNFAKSSKAKLNARAFPFGIRSLMKDHTSGSVLALALLDFI